MDAAFNGRNARPGNSHPDADRLLFAKVERGQEREMKKMKRWSQMERDEKIEAVRLLIVDYGYTQSEAAAALVTTKGKIGGIWESHLRGKLDGKASD